MIQSLPSTSRPIFHPDAKRIAGMAFALLVNAGLLMLLLVPMHSRPAISLPDPSPVVSWIHPRPVVPPKPPAPVPVARAHSVPQAQPQPNIPQRSEASVEDPPVILAQAGLEQAPPAGAAGPSASPTTTPAVRLEYDDAPAPSYPRDALRDGVEGIVLLEVWVEVDGRPLHVDVQHSSGDRRLDDAARRQVLQHWRFRPAMRDGHPVQAIGLVPVAFSLR